MRLLSVLTALFFMFPAAAVAQNTQTATIQTMMHELLETQKRSLKAKNIALYYEGDVSVEQNGEFYAITLPEITITRPDKNVIDVGIISINAAEGENPGEWKMAVALPATLSVKSPLNTDVMKLQIGKQNTALIWDERLKNATKFDGIYSDVKIQFPATNGAINLGQIVSRYDFDESGENLWSGPFHLNVQNANWSLPLFSAEGSLTALQSLFTFSRYPAQAIFSQSSAVNPVRFLTSAFIDKGEKFNAEFTLNGLTHNKTKTISGWTDKIALISASGNLSYDKASGPQTLSHLNLNGLRLDNVSSDMKIFVPENAQADFNLTGASWDKVAQLLNTQSWNLSKLSTALDKGGSFKLSNGKLQNSYYSSDISAIFEKTEAAAPLKGQSSITIVGMDRLIETSTLNANKAPLNAQGMFLRTLPPLLERIKTLAKPANATPGALQYDLVLNENQQFLLNGQPLNQLFIAPIQSSPPPAVETAPQ